MQLAFTISTINPYTGKRLREWEQDGINGFIAECYTRKEAKHNRFIADHCIAWCKNCAGKGIKVPQHSIFGMGKTPSEAYTDCKKQLDQFKCL